MKDKEQAIADKVPLPDDGIDLPKLQRIIGDKLINDALEKHNGVVAHAAVTLGMGRTTLVERIKRMKREQSE